MSATREPNWFDDAQDEFIEVFCRKEKASKGEAKAFFDKWLKKCESEEEEKLFERACKYWMLIRAAVRLKTEEGPCQRRTFKKEF